MGHPCAQLCPCLIIKGVSPGVGMPSQQGVVLG